jgi:hypothetical protein
MSVGTGIKLKPITNLAQIDVPTRNIPQHINDHIQALPTLNPEKPQTRHARILAELHRQPLTRPVGRIRHANTAKNGTSTSNAPEILTDRETGNEPQGTIPGIRPRFERNTGPETRTNKSN